MLATAGAASAIAGYEHTSLVLTQHGVDRARNSRRYLLHKWLSRTFYFPEIMGFTPIRLIALKVEEEKRVIVKIDVAIGIEIVRLASFAGSGCGTR